MQEMIALLNLNTQLQIMKELSNAPYDETHGNVVQQSNPNPINGAMSD